MPKYPQGHLFCQRIVWLHEVQRVGVAVGFCLLEDATVAVVAVHSMKEEVVVAEAADNCNNTRLFSVISER
jgi:hypothetical protein